MFSIESWKILLLLVYDKGYETGYNVAKSEVLTLLKKPVQQ